MSDEPESLPSLNSMDCWDYSVELECLDGIQDLRLAAELGQTLLERNKELELSLLHHQSTVEDQYQKIDHLNKQTAALREVNISRMRIYEQLEVSIQDLERSNHKLVLENAAEKKRIKSANATVESLELKCENLQSTIDELKLQVEALKRTVQYYESNAEETARTNIESQQAEEKHNDSGETVIMDFVGQTNTKNRCTTCPVPQPKVTTEQPKSVDSGYQNQMDSETESIIDQLLSELRKTRRQCTRDERTITELEEQLSTMVQQNEALENQVIELAHREEDLNVKSMHEELISLDEVRLGQTCSKCLRSIDCYNSSSEVNDDDDVSIVETNPTLRASFTMEVEDYPDNQSSPIKEQFENPYKELVEKYESLVEERKSIKRNHQLCPQEMAGDCKALSTDEESGQGDSLQTEKHHKSTRKAISSPTDFSEAETNSSGFTDETSNKSTQTDGVMGSLMCTIADENEFAFCIYDSDKPIDTRFEEMPEYRNVFKQVFKVLKDAAIKKQRGVDLPLLDDYTPVNVATTTSPLDQSMNFPDDDSQSIISTMSELSVSQIEPTTVLENVVESENQPMPDAGPQEKVRERVLRPLMRCNNLEYVSVEVRKRSSSKRKNKHCDRSDSPITHIIGSPKISYSSKPIGRNRREQSKNASPETDKSNSPSANISTLNNLSAMTGNKNASPETDNSNSPSAKISNLNNLLAMTGNRLQFNPSVPSDPSDASAPSDRVDSPTPSQSSSVNYEFKPSTASQDLNKLKRLDLSYAQVLTKTDNTMMRFTNSRKTIVMTSADVAVIGNRTRGKRPGKGNGRNSSRSNPGGSCSRFSKKRPL